MLYLKWLVIAVLVFAVVIYGAGTFVIGFSRHVFWAYHFYTDSILGSVAYYWLVLSAAFAPIILIFTALTSSISTFYLGVREDRRKQAAHEAKLEEEE
jgi:hypothetical protein